MQLAGFFVNRGLLEYSFVCELLYFLMAFFTLQQQS
jgi:hypothetical protein